MLYEVITERFERFMEAFTDFFRVVNLVDVDEPLVRVITSYSIHYTKLYELSRRRWGNEEGGLARGLHRRKCTMSRNGAGVAERG